MLGRVVPFRFLSLIVFAVLASLAQQTNVLAELRSVTALSIEPIGKLAPDLALIVNANARFIGYADDGSTVFDVPDNAIWNREGTVRVLDRDYVIEPIRSERVVEQTAELLLSYRRGAPLKESDVKAAGFEILDRYDRGTFWTIRPSGSQNSESNDESQDGEDESVAHEPIDIDATILPAESLRKLIAVNGVDYIELNYILQLVLPKDGPPPPESVSALSNEDEVVDDAQWRRQWNMRAIGADKAWQRVTEGDVTVAVLGTGVDYRHTDLAQNMWRNPGEVANGIDDDENGIVDDVVGASFSSAGSAGDPLDDNGHGTHSAGTIGAIGNNGIGIAGINWRTRLMAVKCLDDQARGRNADLIRGMYYAIDHRADVVCNSWSSAKIVPSRERREVLAESERRGLIIVTAAGNGGQSEQSTTQVDWIRSAPNVVNVAAVDYKDNLTTFSNYGGQSVDLAAPGQSVVSTARSNGYRYASGTGVATSHVAGAAALIWAANRRLKWDRVKSLLMSNARKSANLSGKVSTQGVLDISFLGGNSRPNRNTPKATPLPPASESSNSSSSASNTDSIAVSQFFYGDGRSIPADQNLLSATITLTRKMTVRIEADASFTTTNSSETFSTSLAASKSMSAKSWSNSIRLVTVSKQGNYVRGRTEFVVDLSAGVHTIYWRVRRKEASGSLEVRGGGMLSIETYSARQKQ